MALIGSISRLDILRGGEIGGASEVVDEHALGRRALLGRHLAGEAMHRAAANRRDVIERAGEHFLKFSFAAGNRRQSERAVARAGRRIDAEHGELVPDDRLLHLRRRHVIGKLQLDRLEAAAAAASMRPSSGRSVNK